MSRMTEDLLMLARSENRVALTVEEVDTVALVRRVADKLRAIADQKGVTILASLLGAPLRVQGNVAGLERVFTNLLQNAVDHTPSGGSVAVDAHQEGRQAVVTVSDTGTGIKEADLPHIFKRFYKGDGTSGSGLGLSIVKELVGQHCGSVKIESAIGKGTVVTVKVPLVA